MTLYNPAPDMTLPVALLGEDYPGLRIRLAVEEGADVAVGQILFHDAKRPAISFASPIQGRVREVTFGPRRTLGAMVIDPVEAGPRPPSDQLENEGDLRAYLLARGAWPAFIARPFGGPPDPDAIPRAIVVSALCSSPMGYAPREALVGREVEFARGLTALSLLTPGLIHLCVEHGMTFSNPDATRIKLHSHRATRAWRTAGCQTARVHPTGADGQVWTIGFQDVTAIGHLLETGVYDPVRVISVFRRGMRSGTARRMALGAAIGPLFDDAAAPASDEHCVSGAGLHGRRAIYLGRFHDAVGTSRLKPPTARAMPRPLFPFTTLNKVLPARVPAVPLMRALSIGDTQTCARLGCLELLEEDVAPLSALCASGTDYGRLLRDVLDQLRKDAA